MKNKILLKRQLINLPSAGQNNLAETMSLQRQLMHYGFMLSQNAFEMVKSADIADIKEYYDSVVSFLKEATGGSKNFKSLYKNFPNDVMSMTEAELWMTQVLHYWNTCEFLPVGRPKDVAFEETSYREVKPCTEEEFLDLFTSLLSSGNSLAPDDIKNIEWFVKSGLPLKYPETIPFKENLAVIVKLCPDFTVKTVTDVLRVAMALSGGDPSLPAIPKVKKGRNKQVSIEERKKHRFKLDKEDKEKVLFLLENSNLDIREMKQGSRYGRWIRLFEVLAIQRLKDKYPKSFIAANHLRNQKRKGKPEGMPVIRTWYSNVQEMFSKSVLDGLTTLSERPGEFIRRIDYLIRTYRSNIDDILKILATKCGNVSTKVLFEILIHFMNRGLPVTNRSIFIKGARKKTPLPDLPALKTETVEAIISSIFGILKDRFSKLSPLGKVYIDEKLKLIPLPTNMRSMSDGGSFIIRGERTKMEIEKSTLRAFVHWFDGQGNQDIDLHGFLLGDSIVQQFGFNGIRSANYGCFSGDVRYRKGACAEYVDIDIEKAIDFGFKYYIMVIHNFQNKPFSKLEECYAGYMETDFPNANSAWLPSNVKNTIKIESNSNYCLLGVFDLQKKEYIHLDMDWETINRACSTSDYNSLNKAINPFISEPKYSVYDLCKLHAESRGTIVNADKAETIFSYDDFKGRYEKILELL